MKRGEFLMHIFEQMGYTIAKTRHFSSTSFHFYVCLGSGIRMRFSTNYDWACLILVAKYFLIPFILRT
jgi:hypothetical protein